jgi:hypothetical protein
MPQKPINDPFAAIRKASTAAPNFDLDTDAIIERLTKWQSLCSFRVTGAKGDSVDIEFVELPKDMDAFVRDLYEFCPDLVDQGTGCVHEMVEMMEETGEELTPEMKQLTAGVDFTDDNYGLEILKREIQQGKKVTLWWD